MAAEQATTGIVVTKKVQEAIIAYHGQCFSMLNQQFNIREQLRQIDMVYMRETDKTTEQSRASLSNKYGDATRTQNITVPVVLPVIEAAVTYQSSVFLTGNPIFGISSDAANEDAALQLESIIQENSTRGGWARHLQMVMRDGFKYNLGAAEVVWSKLTTASLETDLSFSVKQAKQKEVIWQGNTIKHLDLYNCFWDTRVIPAEIHSRGEFAGYTEIMSRIELKSFINKLDDKLVENVITALESGIGEGMAGAGTAESYYTPIINQEALMNKNPRQSTDWLAWASIAGSEQKIQYRNIYEVTTLYAKIIPNDFGLSVPSRNTPQIWKFLIVNHSVVIFAERQTNAHGYLPIIFLQPLEDGLGYQTKSLAQNVAPFQHITSSFWNSAIAARRRAISDRGIYDPSRISEKHINSPNPSAKIPVLPAAYGKPLNESYYSIPFRDDQSGIILQETPQILRMADTVSGQNPARQGQFVKGNKTQHEYADVMANANGRDQNCSLLLEAQFYTPIKEILKINILQYQGATTVYNTSTKSAVSVDPTVLRKSILAFEVSDGLLPTDKLVGAESMRVAVQTLEQSPQLAAAYDMSALFSYLMKTQGAHIAQFEKSKEQLAYEQAVQSWQQAVTSMSEEFKIISSKAETLEDITKLMSELKKVLPPQPQPQQFNYNPQGVSSEQNRS
jgi:hypothetical protein